MSQYEYRVIAAPTRGVKAKGIKSADARFSHALEEMMNSMASEGWEYQRAETLPSVERSGLTSSTTTWRNVLVFRRLKEVAAPVAQITKQEVPDTPKVPLALNDPMPDIVTPDTQDDDASKSQGASRMLKDNGVEELSDVVGITTSLKKLAETRSASKTED